MPKKVLSCLLAACLLTGNALAACGVCGGDEKCDTCLGLGFVMAKIYGSDELVQIGCMGANCADGVCTACVNSEPDYAFADPAVADSVRTMLGQEHVMLSDLQSITELTVHTANETLSFEDISRMPALRKLSIWGAEGTAVDLSHLAGLEGLEEVHVHGAKNLSGLSAVQELPRLSALTLQNVTVFPDLEGFLGRGLTTLQGEDFDTWYAQYTFMRGTECEAEQKHSDAMRWYQMSSRAGNAEALCAMGRMFEQGKGVMANQAQALNLYARAADAGSAEAQRHMIRLQATPAPTPEPTPAPTPVPTPSTHFFAEPVVENMVYRLLKKQEVTTEELGQITQLRLEATGSSLVLDDLKHMPALEKLNISGVEGETDVDLAPLKACKNLKELAISGVGTVRNFSALAEAGGVMDLFVSMVDLTDAEAASIGGLKQLEILYMDSVAVTDFDWLAGCTALREVTIAFTGLTSARGLKDLQNLEFVAIEHNAAEPDLNFLLGRGIQSWTPMGEYIPFEEWYTDYQYGSFVEPGYWEESEAAGEYQMYGTTGELYEDPRGGVRQNRGGQVH